MSTISKKRLICFAVSALVAAGLTFMIGGSADAQTTTHTTTIAKWSRGSEADKVHSRNSLYVRTSKPVRKLCANYTKADLDPSCKLGKKQSDGSRALIPAGVYAVRTPTQACGDTKDYYAFAVLKDSSTEYAPSTFEFMRTCDEPYTQVVYFSGKGAGVDSINMKCQPGTHRIRVWRLYPGKNGNIIDPGVLTIPMGNGLDDDLGDEPGEVSHVPFTRYWEFYQTSERRVDTDNWANFYDFAVASTPDAHPHLRLALSDCIGE